MPAKKSKPTPLSKQEGGAKAKKKVNWNKYNKRCSVDGCAKYAQNGTGVCIKHGAKHKRCSTEGCTNQAISGGVCKRHGAKAPLCSQEGCTNKAVSGGVCQKHGTKVSPKICRNEGCTMPAKKRKSSPLSKQEGGAKAKKKYDWSKYKKRCSADGCEKFAVSGGVCVTHGAKVTPKRCSAEGCTNQVQRKGLCMRHGAKVKQCSAQGCTNGAINGGVCAKHGAKRKLCSMEGCENQAKTGGVCQKHGAIVKQCGAEGCTNQVVSGGVCVTHGAKVKKCSSEGCTNNVVQGGVCKRHGARLKLCNKQGCTNKAQKGGVCWRHGAKLKIKRCSHEGCNYPARKKDGLCYRHRQKKQRNVEAAAEETAVSVPALPPIELPVCYICHDPCDISEMANCAKGCSCTVCHDCLVTGFSKPGMYVDGQLQHYDMARCPNCRGEDAFSLNERDQAIVNREISYEEGSLATSHDDSEYEPTSDEEEDD